MTELTKIQLRLIEEVESWEEGIDILAQLDKPKLRGGWWDYLPGSVQEFWPDLPLDAKLVAVLWGQREKSMDFRDPFRD